MIWSDFFDYILPELPGVAQALVIHTLRNMTAEFCDASHIYIDNLAPIDVVASQGTYPLISPVPDTEVSMVRNAWHDDCLLSFATLETLNAGQTNWMNVEADRPIAFTHYNSDSLLLYPKPRLALTAGLKVQAALRPTRTAPGIVDWLGNNYFDILAKGTMGRLMLQPGKPWMNLELGAHYSSIFESGKGDATISGNRSMTRATVSVQMRPAVMSGRYPVMRR